MSNTITKEQVRFINQEGKEEIGKFLRYGDGGAYILADTGMGSEVAIWVWVKDGRYKVEHVREEMGGIEYEGPTPMQRIKSGLDELSREEQEELEKHLFNRRMEAHKQDLADVLEKIRHHSEANHNYGVAAPTLQLFLRLLETSGKDSLGVWQEFRDWVKENQKEADKNLAEG